ncbi:MAG: hypothetical protein KAJ03_01415 [Gammaproteobacteria bacterium]|nr:hypothetical protein [Gammaproteobacteria bacterium]
MQQLKSVTPDFIPHSRTETDDRRLALRRSMDKDAHAICVRKRILIASLIILNLVVLTGLSIIVTTLK